jgi:hypothetical protein
MTHRDTHEHEFNKAICLPPSSRRALNALCVLCRPRDKQLLIGIFHTKIGEKVIANLWIQEAKKNIKTTSYLTILNFPYIHTLQGNQILQGKTGRKELRQRLK